jgi:hypothetical protein
MTINKVDATNIKKPILIVSRETVNSYKGLDRIAAEVAILNGYWQLSDETKPSGNA